MSEQTIYTKTAKGVLEVKNKTIRLPRDLENVFGLIDGKSTVAEMLQKNDSLSFEEMTQALEKLATDGFIKVFSMGGAPSVLQAPAVEPPPAGLRRSGPAKAPPSKTP